MSRNQLLSLLLGLTAVVYLNSFPGAFHFDDYPLLLENPRVNGQSFPYLSFFEQYGGRPLTFFTFHLNLRIFGEDPFSFHFINFLLHLAVTAFLFLLLSRYLFRDHRLAMVAALLFAIHPLQAQTVNYIWARSFLLMAFFGLPALLLVRCYPWVALGLLQLAVWSRMEAVILVLPMILLNRRFWRAPVCLAVINSTLFIYSMWAFRPAELAWTHPAPLGYWLRQGAAFWKYVGLMTAPLGLAVDHPVPEFGWGWLVWAWGSLIGVTMWMIVRRQNHPRLAAGWLWILLCLTPSMLMPNSEFFSESRGYLALAGFSVMVAELWRRMNRKMGSTAVVALGVIVLVLLGMTGQRNRIWKDDVRLWREAVVVAPEKARTRYNLGASLARAGRTAEAEVEFRKAGKIDPLDDFILAALGYCMEVRQEFRQARSFYREALFLNPRNRYARQGVARLDSNAGRMMESESNLLVGGTQPSPGEGNESEGRSFFEVRE